jgi:hypothetical protein
MGSGSATGSATGGTVATPGAADAAGCGFPGNTDPDAINLWVEPAIVGLANTKETVTIISFASALSGTAVADTPIRRSARAASSGREKCFLAEIFPSEAGVWPGVISSFPPPCLPQATASPTIARPPINAGRNRIEQTVNFCLQLSTFVEGHFIALLPDWNTKFKKASLKPL